MTTFEIGLDDGRKLHIEAEDQTAALAGAQFEGAATAKDAIAHRDWLMKTMPQAAPLLSRYFSDAEISKIWKR